MESSHGIWREQQRGSKIKRVCIEELFSEHLCCHPRQRSSQSQHALGGVYLLSPLPALCSGIKVDEKELQSSFAECQKSVHASLCDNVNTRGAMDAMLDLIKVVNIYLAKKQEQPDAHPHPFLLTRIAGYLTKILSTFGS